MRGSCLTLFLIAIAVVHAVPLFWRSLLPVLPLMEAFWWSLSGLVIGAGLIERERLKGGQRNYAKVAGWLYVVSWALGFCVGFLGPPPLMISGELLKVAIVCTLLILVWPTSAQQSCKSAVDVPPRPSSTDSHEERMADHERSSGPD